MSDTAEILRRREDQLAVQLTGILYAAVQAGHVAATPEALRRVAQAVAGVMRTRLADWQLIDYQRGVAAASPPEPSHARPTQPPDDAPSPRETPTRPARPSALAKARKP